MDWDNLLKEAVKETDVSLANRISSLCHLTDAEIASIAPNKVDKEDLAKILSVVKDATLSNEEKANAIQKISNSLNLLIGIVTKVA